MSDCGRHRPTLCRRQLSHERAHLFLLKSNDCRFRHVSACAWGFTPASGFDFPISFSTIVPCNIFELCSTLAKSAVVVLSSSQTAQLTLKNQSDKVCINWFLPVSICSKRSKAFSFLLNERFAPGLGLWRLGRRSWAQHLAADDGRNGNCGFPTLRNVKSGNLEKFGWLQFQTFGIANTF